MQPRSKGYGEATLGAAHRAPEPPWEAPAQPLGGVEPFPTTVLQAGAQGGARTGTGVGVCRHPEGQRQGVQERSGCQRPGKRWPASDELSTGTPMHVPRAGAGSALWAPESLSLATPRTGWSSSETRAQASARRPSMWAPSHTVHHWPRDWATPRSNLDRQQQVPSRVAGAVPSLPSPAFTPWPGLPVAKSHATQALAPKRMQKRVGRSPDTLLRWRPAGP